MSVIFDNRSYRTRDVAIGIAYDINQLDLSGARLQVKFDAKIIDGTGSKFMVRHSDGEHKAFGDYSSPVMESSTGGTSHVFIVDLTDEIIQKSKNITVSTNGGFGTDVIDLEVKNIEFRILEHVQIDDSLFALKTYQMVKKGETSDTSRMGSVVVVITSEQSKPTVAKMGEVLFESDTGKVFYYDGTEWSEFI